MEILGVSLLAVLASALAHLGVGYIWYHPKVFGTLWMRGAHIAPFGVERAHSRRAVITFAGFVAALSVAFVYGAFAHTMHFGTLPELLRFTAWVSIGFIVPVLAGSVMWEMKPLSYYAVNVTYWIASLSITALIFAFL
jgi:hypothetical protein